MSTFSAEAVLTNDQLVVDDDTTPNARSQSQQNHAAEDLSGPHPELAKSGCVGIVGERYGHADFLFKAFNNRKMMPMRMVGGLDQQPSRDVLASRSPQPNARDLVWLDTNRFEQASGALSHPLHRVHGTFGFFRRDRGEAQSMPLIVDDTDLHPGSTHIDSQE